MEVIDEESVEEIQFLPPLLKAAKDGDVAVFKKLLLNGADVLKTDENHSTVLHWAAQYGNMAIIIAGLSDGLSWHVNTKTKKESLTPLHEASLNGHENIAQMLLALGADGTAQTKEGYTPLLCAAGNGHHEVVRVLLGAGCSGDELIMPIGVNALHIAAYTGQLDVVRVLLELGTGVESLSASHKSAIDYAVKQGHTTVVNAIRDHRKKVECGVSDKSLFRSKVRLVGEKIRDFYEDKLKQEVAFFEEQLEEAHKRDMQIIFTLKEELEKLKLEQPGTSKGNKTYIEIEIPSQRKIHRKSSQKAFEKQSLQSDDEVEAFPIARSTQSGDEGAATSPLSSAGMTSPHTIQSPPSFTSSPTFTSSSTPRPPLSRRKSKDTKSMIELVTKVKERNGSITSFLAHGSDDYNCATPSSPSSPDRINSTRHTIFSPPPMAEVEPKEPLQIRETTSDFPESHNARRKSIADFFRSSSNSERSASQDPSLTRRKSVDSRMQTHPFSVKPKSKPSQSQFIRFQLPGISKST